MAEIDDKMLQKALDVIKTASPKGLEKISEKLAEKMPVQLSSEEIEQALKKFDDMKL